MKHAVGEFISDNCTFQASEYIPLGVNDYVKLVFLINRPQDVPVFVTI
jgi:hypothetical protein